MRYIPPSLGRGAGGWGFKAQSEVIISRVCPKRNNIVGARIARPWAMYHGGSKPTLHHHAGYRGREVKSSVQSKRAKGTRHAK